MNKKKSKYHIVAKNKYWNVPIEDVQGLFANKASTVLPEPVMQPAQLSYPDQPSLPSLLSLSDRPSLPKQSNQPNLPILPKQSANQPNLQQNDYSTTAEISAELKKMTLLEPRDNGISDEQRRMTSDYGTANKPKKLKSKSSKSPKLILESDGYDAD